MIIVGCDQGYRQSAIVVFDGTKILHHQIVGNERLRIMFKIAGGGEGFTWLDDAKAILVMEELQLFASSFGVGKEVFDSVFWSGRFAERWEPRPWARILRSKIRGHLQASKGGDAAVRASLINRFGPFKEDAIGNKKKPGPLYGIKADEWSALAIAVTYWDLFRNVPVGEMIRPGVMADF